jgi:alpha-glucosidase
MAEVRPDAWLVGEHCHDATVDLAGDGWHGVMAYTWFTRPVWSWLTDRSLKALSLLGVPGGFPDIGGAEFVDTFRDLTAGVPWRSVAASMTLLDSHDTARFTTATTSPAHRRVGIGLLMAMPGVPMVFAGDEVGVGGANLDAARQPFPWDPSTWDRDLLATYRDLIALRKNSDALRHGSLRFVTADRDAFAFVRETAGERVLVYAARAAHEPLRSGAADVGVVGSPEQLYGDGALAVRGDAIELSADGPSFAVWRIG